jgi:hypothetical protein
MKIHLLLALGGLAFSFAFPVVAQQTADPKTIEQFDEFNKKFDEAFNNKDAAAVAAFLHGGRGSGDAGRTDLRSGRYPEVV